MLKAADMVATQRWYQRIGFLVRGRYPAAGEPTWLEVSRDGVVLQFLAGDTPWDGPPAFTGTIYVYPPSVLEVHDHIAGDIEPAWGPEARDWGMLEMGLQDPNGYFITFTEPAGAE